MTKLPAELIRSLALAGDDFGFEMRMGKILKSVANAQVEHGGTYTPLGINQSARQFDYWLRVVSQGKVLQLAVECKNLFPGAPVVICGGQRSASESRLEIVTSDIRFVMPEIGAGVQKIASPRMIVAPSLFYPAGEFVGKAVMRPEPTSKERELVIGTRYKLTGDSDIYERWNQAVMHASYLMSKATMLRRAFNHPCFTVTLPIVVVPEDTLWTIGYDENGSIVDGPKNATSTTIYSGREQWLGNVRSKISHIHFLTPTGLSEFIAQVADHSSMLWTQLFSPRDIEVYLCTRQQPVRE